MDSIGNWLFLALTIPVISIIVEGGINSMKTVWQSVMRGIPVLVLQSSGRAADFIAHGYNITANKLKSVQKYIKLAMSYSATQNFIGKIFMMYLYKSMGAWSMFNILDDL